MDKCEKTYYKDGIVNYMLCIPDKMKGMIKGMRERISEPMSEYYKNEIELPILLANYDSIFVEELYVQRAYAIMLVKSGIISKEEGKKIIEGLSYVKDNLKKEDLDIDSEDLYFNIQKSLIEKIGVEIGGKLHMGRSRNDIGSTLDRIITRRSTLSVIEELIELQKELLKKAKEEKDIIITGYTHTQPAQPTCMGHYYTAVNSALNRDFIRLKNAFNNINQCPYGAAASFGATFSIDRVLLAELLGFDKVLENSLDCIASKDFLLELEMSCANMGITISRFIQDLYMWSTYEFGLLEFGGQVAVCSSIMPQKKNASGLEYAKSKVAHTIGALSSSIAALKNIPFANNIDIHEAFWLHSIGIEEIIKVLGVTAECLRYSHVNKDRAYEQAKRNYCTVTGLADYLVEQAGISFDQAHHIVGIMVYESESSGEGIKGMNSSKLEAITKEYLGNGITLPDEEIEYVLDPYNNVQAKLTLGGPQKKSVEKMIKEAEERIKTEEDWLKEKRKKIKNSYNKIFIEEERIIKK